MADTADNIDVENIVEQAAEAVEEAFEELVEDVVELTEQTKLEMAHGAETLKKYLAGN